jgi:hypothetical protein
VETGGDDTDHAPDSDQRDPGVRRVPRPIRRDERARWAGIRPAVQRDAVKLRRRNDVQRGADQDQQERTEVDLAIASRNWCHAVMSIPARVRNVMG